MPWKRSPLVRCLLVVGIPLLATELILSQEIGPANGALVLVGGAMRDPVIVERFLALAGGDDAPVVVIPTAGGEDTYDQSWPGLRAFTNAGATDVTVMHTTDRDVANSESFVAQLRRARGVWFGGGRQWRLVDAYLDTKVHHEIQGVLDRGGVDEALAVLVPHHEDQDDRVDRDRHAHARGRQREEVFTGKANVGTGFLDRPGTEGNGSHCGGRD